MRISVLVGLSLLFAGCSEDEPRVSYQEDINPIFVQRCYVCHHPTSGIVDKIVDGNVYDLTRPFDPVVGIVGRPNSWADEHVTQESLVVDPGNVANSSLVLKVSATEESIDTSNNGHAMPYQIEHLTETELTAVETWIRDGANDDEFYTANVAPIFGTGQSLIPRIAGKCTYCHYPNSPTGLNILNVFDPEDGLVNAKGFSGGTLVIPGDPDNSLLMARLRGNSEGPQMPRHYPRLNADQVQLIVDWIEDGAPNN